jgi:Peptidase family M23
MLSNISNKYTMQIMKIFGKTALVLTTLGMSFSTQFQPARIATVSSPLNIGIQAANASMDSDVKAGTVMRLTLQNGVNINLSGSGRGGMINSWSKGNDDDSRLVWIPVGNNRGYFMKQGTNLVMSVKNLDANSPLEMWEIVSGAWQQIFTMVPAEVPGMYYIECRGMRVNIPYSKHNVRVTLMPNKGRDADQMFGLDTSGLGQVAANTLPIVKDGIVVEGNGGGGGGGGGGYVIPVRGSSVTQLAGDKFSHTNYSGVDFGTGNSNPPVYAVYGGTVMYSMFTNDGGGNSVKVRSNNGEIQYYWHMNSRSVSTGQTITAGQQLGTVGRTGNATGNHLHIEFRNANNTLNWSRARDFEKALGLYVGKSF